MSDQGRIRRGWINYLAVAGMFCTLSGCADSTKSDQPANPAATSEQTPANEATVRPTVTPPPRTPEAAMRHLIAELRANRPEAVWHAMPRRFRQDLNGLVQDGAKKMDPELWNQSMAAWKKLARVLAEKKAWILRHPALDDLSPAQRARLDRHWEGVVELLSMLVESELSNLSLLQAFDGGKFLEQTGGQWLAQLAALSESAGQDTLSAMLAGLSPKTLTEEEQTAHVAWMAEGVSEPVSTFYVVKVEGRWIPAGWADAWEQVRRARAKLRDVPADAFTRQSPDKLETLARVDQALDELLRTQTPMEFETVLSKHLDESTLRELAAVVRSFSGPPEAKTAPVAASPEAIPQSANEQDSITVIVRGAQGTADEDLIFSALQAAIPGDVEMQFQPINEGLKITVGPVRDLDALAKRIQFGEVISVDAKTRTLQIQKKR